MDESEYYEDAPYIPNKMRDIVDKYSINKSNEQVNIDVLHARIGDYFSQPLILLYALKKLNTLHWAN